MPKQLSMGRCLAVGCAEILPIERVLCDRHDAMLWPDLRQELYAKYRPNKPASKVFQEILDRALFEILRAQSLGHRAPREADFECTDEAPKTEPTDAV